MLSRIFEHLRQGTLLIAIGRKISGRHTAEKAGADAYYGQKASTYVEKRLKEDKWHAEQAIIGELLDDVPNGISVLDVPFGTGRFVPMYLEKNMSVHGVEISSDMLAAAKKALGSNYDRCDLHIGSADSLQFIDDKFDLIVCCRFLGLIPLLMAKNVLSEFHRVSKSRVILYMNVRKSGFDFSRLVERVRMLLGGSPRYSKMLSGNIDEPEFLSILEESGFQVHDRRVIRDAPKSTYVFYVLGKLSMPA